MDDRTVLDHINELVAQEKELRSSTHTHTDDDRRRLAEIQHDLDRTWDLLRQRRAHEEFDQNPDESTERPEQQVDKYLQ